jgi:MFS family permease
LNPKQKTPIKEVSFGLTNTPSGHKNIGGSSKSYKLILLASITCARAVYSLNWYTLSPGLSQVSQQFGVSTSGLGILESSFLVGAGLFQIPSTVASARWGGKSLAVSGLLVIAASNIASALANTFGLLIVFRFLLGIGVAMFFAPALGIVGRIFRDERQGLSIGIYNSAFNVGGAVALFGWAYIDAIFTWRGGLIIGAVLAAALGVENIAIVRNSDRREEDVVPNEQVWLFAIGNIGVWAAFYVVGQFLPFFEETVRGVNYGNASFLAAQLFLWPIPGSIVGGILSDRFRNRRYFMLFPGLLFGVITCLVGIASYPETWGILITMGLTDSFIFSAMYASVYQMRELNPNQKIMSISLMNAVQITGAFVGPILFSYTATSLSYTYAWLSIGAFVFPFCIALIIAKEPFGSAGAIEEKNRPSGQDGVH